MTRRYGGIGSGTYGGLDSTKQSQEPDAITNMGGTAPGGVTAFVGGAAQWNTSKGASDKTNAPPGSVVHAAMNMHAGLPDEAPDGSRNVPIHPGIMPGKFRTASDANPRAPDGRGIESNTAVADSGPLAPNGRHRGESPEIMTQPRGPYRN